MSTEDLLLAVAGFQLAFTAAAVVFVIHIRERVTKIEEWVRLTEKRLNGKER